jgi:hypothetical protein
MQEAFNNNYKTLSSSFFPDTEITLSDSLTDLIASGVTEFAGGYYFSKLIQKDPFSPESTFIDRTGSECFYNKLFIEQYTPSTDPVFICSMGVAFARKLAQLLEQTYGVDFKVILSFDIDNLSDCHIRFHKIRANEEWLVEDLEQYKTNAILIIYT